jgi:hypothetical protein
MFQTNVIVKVKSTFQNSKHTFHIHELCPESRAVCEIRQEHMVQPDEPQTI